MNVCITNNTFIKEEPFPIKRPFSIGFNAGTNIIVAIRLTSNGITTINPPTTKVVMNFAICNLFFDILL